MNVQRYSALGIAMLLLLGVTAGAAETNLPPRVVVWDLPSLFQPPKLHEATNCVVAGMRNFFYEGADYKGKPAWAFAYYAAPSGTVPEGGWPAVVCAHGGGGTAYPDWVKAWNNHGYAAISMDLEGHLPNRNEFGLTGPWPGGIDHPNAGPARIDWFGDRDLPDREKWFYHAVAHVIRANSLLRSFPEINPKKVGATGISWGGTVVSAVAGLDDRLAFVVPVYGCGFIHESDNDGLNCWFPPQHMTAEQFRDYKTKWDPSAHLPYAKMPMLWMSGFDDPVFQCDIFAKSARVTGGPSILCVRGRMVHGHGHGWQKHDLFTFADIVVKGGEPYPTLGRPGVDPATGKVRAKMTGKVQGASLYYTVQGGKFKGRWWDNIPCEIAADEVVSQQPLPKGVTAYNVNGKDGRGLLVSSDVIIVPAPDPERERIRK